MSKPITTIDSGFVTLRLIVTGTSAEQNALTAKAESGIKALGQKIVGGYRIESATPLGNSIYYVLRREREL